MRLTRLSLVAPLAAMLAAGAPPTSAEAQDPVMTVADRAERAPRFYVASAPKPVPVDASRMPVLRQRISVDFSGMRLGDALEVIAHKSGLRLMYSWTVVPVDRVVTLKAENITVAGALSEVLFDAGVDVLFERDGQAAIVKRPAPPVVGTITGVVTEATTNQPISQAQVSVVGTSLRRATGEDGRYTIASVPAGQHTVTVRRLGYDPMSQNITVRDGESVTLDFALVGAPTRLAEVVTTVTGGQRRVEMGTSIASINADSLMQIAPVMSFGDLLQGRAPGVLSLPEGGNTGQAGRIRIRGLSSLTVSNDPIVVVDGIRVEAGAGTGSTGATVQGVGGSPVGGFTGRLADLAPDEMASVEIVKGPAAATLYGTDAANGVIVITTKRGQAGRTRLTAFTEQGLLEQGLDLTTAFRDGYYAFGRSTVTNVPQRCTLLGRANGSCAVDSLSAFNTYTNPDTRPFKDGYRRQYGLQVSGGTAGGSTYFLSGDYEHETGTAYMPEIDQALIRTTQRREVPDWQRRPNAYKRVNLRANLTAPLGRRGSATLATGFISNQARQPRAGFPLDQVGFRDTNDGWPTFGGIVNSRPAYLFASRGEDVARRFLGSLATSYMVSDWLTLRGTMGADLSTNAFGDLERRGEGQFIGALAFLNTGTRVANELSIARYSLDLGTTATRALSAAVSSRTSVGVQYNRRAQRGANVRVSNLPLGGETLAGGTVLSTSEATQTTAVAGGYVEEVLALRDRLFLTGALRFDGGSAFGQDFSVAAYPKASVSWVVTDGHAGARLPGVGALRLRAAYGASGVQPGPTDALALVTVATGSNVAGTATAPTAVLVGGNPDLKPERSSEVEAGLDLELWQSRLRLEFTGYQRTSMDALFNRPNGTDVGGSRIENLGSVRNRGLELVLDAELLRGRTLAAGFTATGTLNQNRLLKLGEGVAPRNPGGEGGNEVGYPVFGLWGFAIESFADANGNGIIEPAELVFSPETRFIGSSVPGREATVAPYLKLFGQRLHLSGLFQYRRGFYRLNSPAANACTPGLDWCRAVNDLSTPLAEQARAVARRVFNRAGPYMEDGSYLLLRELSMGLTVPSSAARALGAQAGTVVLAGRNLALLWKASDVPLESASISADGNARSGFGNLGSSTYWLLRVHLTY